MSSATRKLFYLFFLGTIAFCNSIGQIPIPVGPVAGALLGGTKPVKLFKSYKFDTTDAIIGMGFSDSLDHRYEKFNFIINNVNDLNDLKKSWVFKQEVNREPSAGAFKIYYVKNKTIRSSWVILPDLNAIITEEGFYYFDMLMLASLHTQGPLVYSTRTDTLQSKSDFLRYNDSVKTIPSFLFLNEPNFLYEGSFEITIKPGSTLSPDAVGERIMTVCNKVKSRLPFKIFIKDDNQNSGAKYRTYVVQCDHHLFEQFADADMEKAHWTPATFVVQSFWRK